MKIMLMILSLTFSVNVFAGKQVSQLTIECPNVRAGDIWVGYVYEIDNLQGQMSTGKNNFEITEIVDKQNGNKIERMDFPSDLQLNAKSVEATNTTLVCFGSNNKYKVTAKFVHLWDLRRKPGQAVCKPSGSGFNCANVFLKN